jgi:hypothetical protein
MVFVKGFGAFDEGIEGGDFAEAELRGEMVHVFCEREWDSNPNP